VHRPADAAADPLFGRRRFHDRAYPRKALLHASAANQWSGLALAFSIDLPANTPLQVRVGVRRDDTLTGTTGIFVNAKCQMTVSIVNANGSMSPL
jgi:hypothetical protein